MQGLVGIQHLFVNRGIDTGNSSALFHALLVSAIVHAKQYPQAVYQVAALPLAQPDKDERPCASDRLFRAAPNATEKRF